MNFRNLIHGLERRIRRTRGSGMLRYIILPNISEEPEADSVNKSKGM